MKECKIHEWRYQYERFIHEIWFDIYYCTICLKIKNEYQLRGTDL